MVQRSKCVEPLPLYAARHAARAITITIVILPFMQYYITRGNGVAKLVLVCDLGFTGHQVNRKGD